MWSRLSQRGAPCSVQSRLLRARACCRSAPWGSLLHLLEEPEAGALEAPAKRPKVAPAMALGWQPSSPEAPKGKAQATNGQEHSKEAVEKA